MRAFIIMLLVTMLIVLLLFAGRTCGQKKAYIEQLMTAKQKAERASMDAKANTIRAALESYYADNDKYPDMLDALVPYYIRARDQILDTWGQPFKLETYGEMDLILISSGKDRVFETSDDIKRRI